MVTLLVLVPGSPSLCICIHGCPQRSDKANCDGSTKVKDLIRETMRLVVFWDDGPNQSKVC